MTEQQATDKLEQIVGNVDKCFRLMRLYSSSQAVDWPPRHALTKEQVFKVRAKRDGYTDDAISHYLNHIV